MTERSNSRGSGATAGTGPTCLVVEATAGDRSNLACGSAFLRARGRGGDPPRGRHRRPPARPRSRPASRRQCPGRGGCRDRSERSRARCPEEWRASSSCPSWVKASPFHRYPPALADAASIQVEEFECGLRSPGFHGRATKPEPPEVPARTWERAACLEGRDHLSPVVDKKRGLRQGVLRDLDEVHRGTTRLFCFPLFLLHHCLAMPRRQRIRRGLDSLRDSARGLLPPAELEQGLGASVESLPVARFPCRPPIYRRERVLESAGIGGARRLWARRSRLGGEEGGAGGTVSNRARAGDGRASAARSSWESGARAVSRWGRPPGERVLREAWAERGRWPRGPAVAGWRLRQGRPRERFPREGCHWSWLCRMGTRARDRICACRRKDRRRALPKHLTPSRSLLRPQPQR